MAYAALAEYLEELAGCGQLVRIACEVDPAGEIAEITRRVARRGGPALLFERIRGQSMAVATNVLGTEAQVCHALDVESPDAIIGRIEALIREHTPQNWFERLKTSDDAAGVNKFRPKSVKAGPCQQVVRLGRDVDLGLLPLVKQSPGDAHAALLGGQLIAQALGSEQRSVNCCNLFALEPNRMAVVATQGGALAQHWADYRHADERMPLAIVVGGDPACVVAANLELPPGIDCDHLAGLLRGRAVDLVKCRTHAIDVPADAELIIEGYLDPEAPDAAVPCDSTFGGSQQVPVLHVAAVTHRSHPILWTSIDTGEHGEPAALLKVRERVLLPALRTIAPGIVDVHLPALGGLHNYAFVSVTQSYPHQARQIASALWGSAALRFIKFLVLLDADVKVRQVRSVLAEIGAHAQPERDFFVYDGPMSNAPFGRHIGIDATRKTADHSVPDAGNSNGTLAELEELVTRRWAEYGFSG